MKRYDSYKPSGIEWIGEIPSHWSVNRLKFEIGLHGRIGWNGLRSDEFQVVSHAYLVTGQDFDGSDIPWDKCYQIDKERYEEDPFIQLTEGDILVTKDGSIGKVAMVRNLDKPACLNSGIFVLKQKHETFNQLYLYWLLNSDVFKGFISYHQSGSTILHLYQNVFDNMPTLVPPLEEQIILSNYLEKKCGEIDRSIAKQQRRIELLEELKHSVITQAVTRGLDPNVPLRDSGINWIGQIPEHWKRLRLKHTALQEGGMFIDGDWIESKDISSEGVKYLTSGNVGVIKYKEQGSGFITDETFNRLECKNVYPGDILISRLNEPISRACLVPELNSRIVTCVDNVIYRPDNNIFEYRFIVYVLNNYYYTEYVNLIARGATMHRIARLTLGGISIPVPSKDEQQAIADYLDKRCAEIDGMIEREKRRIELMQELKQSIITEIVTGKRKVV